MRWDAVSEVLTRPYRLLSCVADEVHALCICDYDSAPLESDAEAS